MSTTMSKLEKITEFQQKGADIARRRQLLEVEAQSLDLEVQEWLKSEKIIEGDKGEIHLIDVIKRALETSCEPKLILS